MTSGFMLGDGMWEGMRLYDGVWAFFDEHMDRFFASCKAVSLDVGRDRAGIMEALTQTAAANGMVTDAHCRLMLTRGRESETVSAPVTQPVGPDPGDHHRAFETGGGAAIARHPAGHGAAGARVCPCRRTPSTTAIPS